MNSYAYIKEILSTKIPKIFLHEGFAKPLFCLKSGHNLIFILKYSEMHANFFFFYTANVFFLHLQILEIPQKMFFYEKQMLFLV